MVKKERNRYILFKVIAKGNSDLDQREVLNAIWQSIWKYFGLREASKIGLWLLDIDFKEGFGVILDASENSMKDLFCFIREIIPGEIVLITFWSENEIISTRESLAA
ncbi:hypothetical protein ES708_09659 [subsurface metagenome]